MKRLWIVAGALLVAAAAGCNRWDDTPYPPPYYQQPYYYQQPAAYQVPACPPGTVPAATTYVPPAAGPCAPAATVRPAGR
jgi:hypothetical protein